MNANITLSHNKQKERDAFPSPSFYNLITVAALPPTWVTGLVVFESSLLQVEVCVCGVYEELV